MKRALVPLVSVLVGLAAIAPGGVASADPESAVDVVRATVETDAVSNRGDAADDPGVWVDPDEPARSAVIGTDKQGGLSVYDLSGALVQHLPVGEVNNVDVQSVGGRGAAFQLGGERVSLVVTGNRSNDSIGTYVLDPASRRLQDVSSRVLRAGISVYGSCLYSSGRTGRTYVFITSKRGEVRQFELFDDGRGEVGATRVRSFDAGGQAEGCVADDELGHLYIGEEERGIWKYGADPEDGTGRTLVSGVGRSSPLTADVEGLSISYGRDHAGFLFASSQGDDSYAVFRREGRNEHVRSFRIGRAGQVDGTEDTDGIDVVATDLGPRFPGGVFVAQDGRNDGGRSNQNFKLVPYEDVVPQSAQ